jgi:hydrogenase maturation protein HypF
MVDAHNREITDDDLSATAAELLKQGAILAVKGLGGYHLACNAVDDDAVRRLRARKHREDKPFALMVRNVSAARALCFVMPEDEMLLCSQQRPIVLLRKREDTRIAEAVAPGQRHFGLMLPYTPLHLLLLADVDIPLIMTSGNLSENRSLTRTTMHLADLATSPSIFWSTTGRFICAATIPSRARSIRAK